MKHLDFTPLPTGDFYGFRMHRFSFENAEGHLIFPHAEKNGKWIFKTEYLGAFPAADLALLEQGFCIAHIDKESRFATEKTVGLQSRFAAALPRAFGLSAAFGLTGLSLGGLQALCLAAHPELSIGAIYLDAPVVDLCSCPLDLAVTHEKDEQMALQCLRDYGKPLSFFKERRSTLPLFLQKIAARRIPTLLLCGTEDCVVPFAENGALLCDAYQSAGAPIKVTEKPGCGHHPHGLCDPAPIVGFFQTHL